MLDFLGVNQAFPFLEESWILRDLMRWSISSRGTSQDATCSAHSL